MQRESTSEAQTVGLGETLGPLLEPGDVIALEGPLGAGKTRFVAGVARGLDVKARVRSPTFTLVNEYHGRIPLLHVDLYRLEPREVESLALEERLEGSALVVEWAEKLPASLQAGALEVRMSLGRGNARTIEVLASGTRAADLLERWQHALARGAA